METKPLICRTIFRVDQFVPIQFNSFLHNLFANLKKLHAFFIVYGYIRSFYLVNIKVFYGGQVNHSVFWLAPILQNTFLLNTGEKQNQTRRCGTVYLSVDVVGVCEVFLCLLGCVSSAVALYILGAG